MRSAYIQAFTESNYSGKVFYVYLLCFWREQINNGGFFLDEMNIALEQSFCLLVFIFPFPLGLAASSIYSSPAVGAFNMGEGSSSSLIMISSSLCACCVDGPLSAGLSNLTLLFPPSTFGGGLATRLDVDAVLPAPKSRFRFGELAGVDGIAGTLAGNAPR